MKYWSFVDEEKILEKLLKDPYEINDDPKVKIKVLIKHYKREGYSKNEIRNLIDDFMIKYKQGFVLADWDDVLKRLVNKYTKKDNCEFRKTADVVIYKEELDFISSGWNIDGVDSIEVEKVLFAMLVLAKSNGGGSWMNYNDKIVFDLARYKFDRRNREVQKGTLFYELSHIEDKKVLECMLYSRSGSIKLFYNQTEGEEVIRIKNDDDIENIIVKYLDWRQKPFYRYCKCCGKEIKMTSNSKKYCTKCSKNIELKRKR